MKLLTFTVIITAAYAMAWRRNKGDFGMWVLIFMFPSI